MLPLNESHVLGLLRHPVDLMEGNKVRFTTVTTGTVVSMLACDLATLHEVSGSLV